MRGRNQDSLSLIGNSIKGFALVGLLFLLKYICIGLIAVFMVLGFYFMIKEYFQNK
jgi:hypothetical protein